MSLVKKFITEGTEKADELVKERSTKSQQEREEVDAALQ